VPLWKVDFNAGPEYELVQNYKVLQDCFNKLSIEKDIDVPKIIKGRPLDSLEFMQWFKGYFDKITHGNPIPDYDPTGRRMECKTGDYRPRTGASKGKGGAAGVAAGASFNGTSRVRSPLKDEATKRIEALAKEKEFYFQKLRDIELLCQTPGVADLPVMRKVEEILYAPTQQEGHRLLLEAQRMIAAAAEEEAAAAADAGQEEAEEEGAQMSVGGTESGAGSPVASQGPSVVESPV